MPHSFRDLRRFLVVFLGQNTVKTGHNLENIYKYEKILTNNFFKNLKMCFKQRNKFAWWYIFFRDLWWLLGGFLRAKIVKSEHNFKNIHKPPKGNFTKILSEILINNLKEIIKFRKCHIHVRELWWFLCVFRAEALSKLTLQILANMAKIT